MYRLFTKTLTIMITLFFIGFLLFKYPAIGKKAGELAEWFGKDENIQNTIQNGKEDLNEYIDSGEYPTMIGEMIESVKTFLLRLMK